MPFPEDPCSTCQFAGTATVCYCQSANSRALCTLAARDPAYRAEVRRRTLDEEGAVIEPTALAAPPAAAASAPPLDEWQYVTTERLLADTRILLANLPPDIDRVIAIPRSGLLPGSLIAYHRHVPLWTISRQAGLQKPGYGGRMEGADDLPPPRHVLLIDDTVALGREMTANTARLRESLPDVKITRAAVYVLPQSTAMVDHFVSVYPGLHYLEWNWTNAGHGQTCAYDFDGILCPDFTSEQCRDMGAYRAAMAAMPPRQLPRRMPIHTIVTGRPESCRDVTLEWLDRWGIEVHHLVMWPGKPHPPASEVAPWKAEHYTRSQCPLFAESDPEQARIINEITGKPVLCPALGRVLPPRVTPARTPYVDLRPLVWECDYRGEVLIPRCGCQAEFRSCGLRKGMSPGAEHEVSMSDCLRCDRITAPSGAAS